MLAIMSLPITRELLGVTITLPLFIGTGTALIHVKATQALCMQDA
jgi:hypothetical protein